MRLELPYIAAFLDCDGCITSTRASRGNGQYRYYGVVCFASQNRMILEAIQSELGGNIGLTGLVYQLQLPPLKAVAAIKKLLPYLRIKKVQGEMVLALHEHIDKHKKSTRPEHFHHALVWTEREQIHNAIHALNHADSIAIRAHRTNRVNSAKASGDDVTLSQAVEGEVGSTEGATTRGVSPNNNPLHERPARKGRHSLSNADITVVQ